MTDVIAIRNLRVPTRIGVTAEERAQPQTVLVSIEMRADLAVAGDTDDLAETIDYNRVTTEVAELVRATEVHLLETLAEQIASLVGKMSRVGGVTVEVAKERLPMAEDVDTVSVRIERQFGADR